MSFNLTSLVRRLEWLESRVVALTRELQDAREAAGKLRLDVGGVVQDPSSRGTRLVILRPDAAVDPATFTPAGSGPYVPPRIVPESGTGRVWTTYDRDTGELRAREFVSRWDPLAEPPAPELVDAPVDYDNINPSEGIPSGSRYVICMEQDGRLIAVTWECV